MKLILPLLILFVACQPKEKAPENPVVSNADTVIVEVDMNETIAGSAYRKRATGYFLVIGSDSSAYMPAFTESNEGQVSLILGLFPNLTYQEQMEQLSILLPHVIKSYPFDSLRGISFGRLIQTGDLAIDVTNEYLSEFGNYGSTATNEYKRIADFLARSKLGRDVNDLFEPYDLQVNGVSVEKVFFTSLHKSIKIDSSKYINQDIPDQILDCMTWVELGTFED